MCGYCGCSSTETMAGSGHGHHHSHDHGAHHSHGHHHHHHHDHEEERTVVELSRAVLDKNSRLAERARGFFMGKGVTALNLVSSPGSGKTTLLEKTVAALKEDVRCAVIVGDCATENDARRIREQGIPAVQVTTGTVCHLDAHMVLHAIEEIDMDETGLLFIENVGNLVCPAAFDLGEECRIVLTSVTEGEDKPKKYPPVFHTADVVVVTKVDLADAVGFDRDAAIENIRDVAPGARIFEVSARTGQGMPEWIDWLRERVSAGSGQDWRAPGSGSRENSTARI